jgi:opine dehydrogenase
VVNITVCGEGTIAHSIAAVSASRGFPVTVYTTRPALWRSEVCARLQTGEVLPGKLRGVTRDARMALRRADLVFLCGAHATRRSVLQRLASHVGRDVLVGAIPGFGGFGYAARALLPPDTVIFGAQRIPYVVAAEGPACVGIRGVRRQTFIGTSPARHAGAASRLLGEILAVRTVAVSHFLNVELSPSNSLVNPARLHALFGSQRGRGRLSSDLEFFTDWDMRSSHLLLELDRELQEARRRIPRDTSFVAPILLQYEANDAAALTRRFRSLTTLAGRRVPLRRVGERYRLDPRSPYVLEDIDYGLALVHALLRLAGAQCPCMEAILAWRRTLGTATGTGPVIEQQFLRAFATIDSLAAALD